MPPKKKIAAEPTHDELGQPLPAKVVVIKRRNDWMSLYTAAKDDHWRTLRVTIQFREQLHAGKPAALDAAEAMIKARGLEDTLEATEITDPAERALKADEVGEKGGLCEFHRREGKPGLWMPTNNVKAMIKENWSVLGFRVSQKGSRGALAEGTFVISTDREDPDWLFLGPEPQGVHTGVAHTTGPSGPQSSIKRNEYLLKPILTFDIRLARAIANKIDDASFARMLYHASEHGLGANRSQGFGRFEVKAIEEVDDKGAESAAAVEALAAKK